MTDALRIVVPRFGSHVSGGSEAAMRRLAGALSVRGWAVDVWTTMAHNESTWATARDVAADDPAIAVRRFHVRLHRHPAAFAQMSRVFFRLPRWLRWETPWLIAQGPYSPGLVHALSHAGGATLFTPYLFHPTLRGIAAAPHPRILLPAAHDERPLRLRAVAAAIAAADALWFHSEEERELTLMVHPAAAAKPSAVGTTGVDPPRRPNARGFASRWGLHGQYLLHGGRTAPGKGVEELLDNFVELRRRRPEVSLVLTGEAGANAAAAGVVPTGQLSDADRWDAIAGASMVVVPGELESLSLLALESWAVGRPVLSTANSAVMRGHASRAGGALLYSSSDDFVRQAERLLDDPVLGRQLGRTARQHVIRTYRWDAVETRLRTLIANAQR